MSSNICRESLIHANRLPRPHFLSVARYLKDLSLMAEPLSLLANIAGVIGACGKLIIAIRDIRDAVKNAPATLQGIATDCTTTTAVLRRLETLLRNQPQLLGDPSVQTSRRTTTSSEQGSLSLKDSFETLVKGIREGIDVLVHEIKRFSSSAKEGRGLVLAAKVAYVWKEGFIKECRLEMREQRSSLAFLLDCIQTESLASIKLRLEDRDQRDSLPGHVTSAELATGAPNSPVSTEIDRLSLLETPKRRLFIGVPKESDLPETQAMTRQIRIPPGKTYRTKDATLIESLHSAIENFDVKGVTKALSKRVDPNAILPNSELRPLLRALGIRQGEKRSEFAQKMDRIIFLLVLANADLDVRSVGKGETPLNLAIKSSCSAQVIRLMCEMGADVDVESDCNGLPALHHAAANNASDDVVRALVANGADLDRRSASGGKTALWYAVENMKTHAATKLLQYGCDPNIETSDGETPLMNAMRGFGEKEGVVDLVQLLCNYGASVHLASNPPVQGICRLQPLAFAMMERCSVEVAQILLHAGAGVNGSGQSEELTPLVLAAVDNNVPMVKFLIEKARAEIERPSGGTIAAGATPLYVAIANASDDVARYLIQRGADTNARPPNNIKGDHVGRTMLHIAVRGKANDLVRLLLDHGALPDSMTRIGEITPLMTAAELGHEEAIRLLLEHGAYVECKNEKGTSPLVMALFKRHHVAAAALVDGGADLVLPCGISGQQPLHYAAQGGMNDIVPLLLDKGVPVDARSLYGVTPLHLAVARGHLATTRLLLERGANMYATDVDGGNILNWAVQGKAAMLQFILRLYRKNAHGELDINAADKNGSTPLHRAAHNCDLACVRILLDHGARQSHCPKYYRNFNDYVAKENALAGTPAMIARAMGREEVAKLIEGWKYPFILGYPGLITP